MNIKENIKNTLQHFVKSNDYQIYSKELFCHIVGKELIDADHQFSPEEFIKIFERKDSKLSPQKNTQEIFTNNIERIHISQQLTEENIRELAISKDLSNGQSNKGLINSFLFLTVRMKPSSASNKKSIYAKITRIINRSFGAPAVVLFCCQQKDEHSISLSFMHHRQHKIIKELDVVGKVSMLHNISCSNPHRAHLEIIADLHIPTCLKKIPKDKLNFDGLMEVWLDILDIDELSKRFYNELYAWFEKAINSAKVKFPKEYKIKAIGGSNKSRIKEKSISKQEQIIRLITRFMFVWFMKEKNIIPDKLFDEKQVDTMLKDFDKLKGDNYYLAILQNLFFGTLNTPIKDEQGKDNRKFSSKSNQGHRVFTSWRYKDMLKNSQEFKAIMNSIPFINGGLFECLDSNEASGDDAGYRLDCFTDNPNQRKDLSIPNHLFFSNNKKGGLIDIFNRYKFTVEENTPLDIDVALDPELLGKVFENLLATYNPETQKTARKSSGSYYTPRSVVDYMVTSSLKEYLKNYLAHAKHTAHNLQNNLNDLFNPELEGNPFDPNYIDIIIKAISNVKVLDPAVGSGAFPMEVLRTCVELLQKLDPDNQKWKKQQLKNLPEMQELAKDIVHAEKINYQEAREKAQEKLKERQNKIEDDFNKLDHNYLRKLYLIRKNIYGIDIQPIACQIAKLRFFITLTIEQQPHYEDGEDNNFGIQSLPNLETNFICADTLMNLYKPTTDDLYMDEIDDIKIKLQQNRDAFFTANTRRTKLLLINKDKEIRNNLWEALQKHYEPLISHKDKVSKNSKLKDEPIRIQETIDKIASWNLMDQITTADWFDAEWMLGVKNGFDLVIGNPPYISSKNMDKVYKKRKEFNDYMVHQGATDIYTYFYERGHNLLKPSGFLSFITSNKWLRGEYGYKLRKLIKERTVINQIIDLGNKDIFKAAVDTNIILFSKEYPKQGNNFLYGEDLPEGKKYLHNMKQSDLSLQLFTLESQEVLEIKNKMNRIGIQLNKWNDIKDIRRGVITGCNDAFIISNEQKKELCRQDPKSAEVVRPLLRGKDIYPYLYKWRERWLIFTHNGYKNKEGKQVKRISINDYLAIKEHLEQYSKTLKNRIDQGDTYYNMRNCAYIESLEKNKIIWQQVTSQPKFSLDLNKMYIINSAHFILSNTSVLSYLLGILNSQVIMFLVDISAHRYKDTGYRLGNSYIEQIPIPKISSQEQQPIINLVETIIKKKEQGESTKREEEKIDQYVYNLYKLTSEQIQIVEDRVAEIQARRTKK